MMLTDEDCGCRNPDFVKLTHDKEKMPMKHLQPWINNPRILTLVVTKTWFDKILSGHKKEDFRTFKPYWVKRLRGEFDWVRVVNGYGKHRPALEAEFKGVRITDDDELTDLGTGVFFAIGLGEILSVENVYPIKEKNE